jgi:quinol monooxygenase YgiN
MHIVLVEIAVKPEFLGEFMQATRENASKSILEEGVMRFDVLQKTENPCNIVLMEVYRTQEDHLAHRETAHYKKWRDQVTSMMAGPRVGTIYKNLFPDDFGWEKA